MHRHTQAAKTIRNHGMSPCWRSLQLTRLKMLRELPLSRNHGSIKGEHMPIKKLKPDADHFGIDEDWQGNNAAFRCPIREQVFILSEIIHYGPDGKGYRRCPNCEKCIACAKVGRKSGGEASIEWPDYFKLGHYPISEKVDNFDEHGLVFFTTIIFQTTPGSMVEHIKIT